MRWRNLIVVLMSAFLVAACGGDDDAKDSDAISVDDGPGVAGPPAPAGSTTTTVAAGPGRQIPAPWSAPTSGVAALIRKAGLPALPEEMLQYHLHSHLDVIVDGAAQPVPADLGIDRVAGVLSPLHTHDDTGLIHVENDEEETFYLGQLFIEWNVRLDSACVGSYCSATTPVKYYVDGEEYTGDPTKIEFQRHREIAVVIGKPPRNIPSKYDFPPNT